MLEGHIYARPENQDNAGATGFDANGYPDNLQLTLDMYADGDKITKLATARDVQLPQHRLSFDRPIQHKNRLQLKITANRAQFALTGIQQYLKVSDTPDAPGNLVVNESVWQRQFGSPLLRIARSQQGAFVNVRTGVAIAATFQATAGPDGRSKSAMLVPFANAQGLISSNLTISKGTVLVWTTAEQAEASVLFDGVALPGLAVKSQYGDWYLIYATGVTASPGSIVLSAEAGDERFFDFTILPTSLGADAIQYYFDDVATNLGKIMVPRL